MPKALNLKDFIEHFDFTCRVTTGKAKITNKTINLQHFIHFRNDSTDFSRLKSISKTFPTDALKKLLQHQCLKFITS